MEMSQSITKISAALLTAQKKMGNAVKDSKNPFFKSSYADLNAIREVTIPVLNEVGITVLQPIIQKEKSSFVRTMLLHESGEFLTSDTEIVVAKQNDPQAQGSGISYARRYGLQAMLNVGSEDDDGEKAMGRSTPAKEAPKKEFHKADLPVKKATFNVKKEFAKIEKKHDMAVSSDTFTVDQSEDDGWD